MIAVVAGAVMSVALMLRVGQRNSSAILLGLFGIWVVSPFVPLALAAATSKSWQAGARTRLLGGLALTLGTLAIYSAIAFGPPRPKPAFAFLVVPLVSWVLIAITAAIARRRA